MESHILGEGEGGRKEGWGLGLNHNFFPRGMKDESEDKDPGGGGLRQGREVSPKKGLRGVKEGLVLFPSH